MSLLPVLPSGASGIPQVPIGMFGGSRTGGFNKAGGWADKVGGLGAALLTFGGNPLGGALMQDRQRRQMMEAEQAQYDRRLADQWGLWQAQEDYRRTRPEVVQPTGLEREYGFIKQTLGDAGATQFLQNKANPIQGVPITNPDGSSGILFTRPGSMVPVPATPTAPVGRLTPIQGGAPSRGGASFR